MFSTLLYMIPVLLIGGVIAYVFSQQQKKATKNIDMDALRNDKKQVSQEFLDRQVPYLKEWMKGNPIDACTSATLPSNMGDFVKTAIKDTIRQSLTYNNTNTVETPAFFILSGKELHFINTDKHSDLSEHIVFDVEKLQTAEIKFAGAKREMGLNMSALSGQDHPKVYDIVIESDKGKSILQAIDRIVNSSFTDTDISQMFKGGYAVDMAKAKITSEYFFEKLGEFYPNLKVEVTH
ncbi:hypothetical protein V9L05_04905 [Bernardetia sp. Wsw4-3y2]|uniref:hypothetical protein n=1 Tax=Bernardetia sp. Wsw4-3y2 TaxID=3127471 RepID=UPI0030D144BD